MEPVARRDISTISKLLQKQTIERLSGKQKQAYRYVLCAIFINIIGGQHFQRGQEENFELARQILKLDRRVGIRPDIYNDIKNKVKQSMKRTLFKYSEDPAFITHVIQFFRDRLKDIQENKRSLFQVSEIEHLIDIKKYMLDGQGIYIHSHHWLEFSIELGIFPTYSVPIIFNDLKVHWNSLVEVSDYLEIERSKVMSPADLTDFLKRQDIREARNSLSAFHRTLIFTAVTLLESYLLDVFYNIKDTSFLDKETIQSKLAATDNINDTEIIENILFVLFPELKAKTTEYYSKYKVLNELRNSYVHASTVKNLSNRHSRIQLLLNLNNLAVAEYLNTCIIFMQIIESYLPKELKLLYWWNYYGDEHIDFNKFLKLSLTSSSARIAGLKYHYDGKEL